MNLKQREKHTVWKPKKCRSSIIIGLTSFLDQSQSEDKQKQNNPALSDMF